MTRMRLAAAILSTLSFLAVAPGAARAHPPAELQEFLREVVGFNDADIAAVENGQVISRLLPETDKGEIAAFGIVRVMASADRLQQLALEVKSYRSMEGVVQIHGFSDPPAPGDCDALVVPDQDIDAIRNCRSGDCDVKITDDMVTSVSHIDWTAPGARDKVVHAFREMVVTVASGFRSGGIDRLGVIVDKKDPKPRAREFQKLLANSPYLFKYVKDFHDYLAEYPNGSFPGAKSTLYWTKDTFSPKPVIAISCQTVARRGEMVMIASELVAASHYFNAGLDVCVGVPSTPGGAMYLVDVYRVRIDPPTGVLAGTAMKKVRGGIKDGVQKGLTGLASKLK
jgi:hypothetical protein